MIETFSLSISRDGGKTPAVSSLCLRVESGESCALLGANGAGKSTLMLSLVGLAPILLGRAEVCGLEVAKKNLRRIRALAKTSPSAWKTSDFRAENRSKLRANGSKNFRYRTSPTDRRTGFRRAKKSGQPSAGSPPCARR